MKQLRINILFYAVLFVGFGTLTAQTELPSILSDNMCLQQSSEVKIWGWDNPGQAISVKPSWSDAVKTKTSDDGKWLVLIQTPKSGKPGMIKVTGSKQLFIHNILFGEVWLCSGQSNMDRQLGFRSGQKPIVNFWEESQRASIPGIRMFQVPKQQSGKPLSDCEGKWVECTPETVLEFSAVGYFYGKALYHELNVPVGLIQSAWGGTKIEPWTPQENFEKETLERIHNLEQNYQLDSAYYQKALKNFKDGIVKKWPDMPESVSYQKHAHQKLAALYNGMISPRINYRIKGAIWYQGESNRSNWKEYKMLFPNMITGWREKWDIGDFPFYFVQIAPYNYTDKFAVPQIVEAQCEALKLPNTGVAATQDIGSVYDIHPPQKMEVGRRLSLVALNKTYGKPDVVYSGPFLSSCKNEGENIVLHFETPGSELISTGNSIGKIWSFYIACENKIFFKANVKQVGNNIILSSPKVKKPMVVRYNWANNANATIYNKQGLPALPFRTDSWDEVFYVE